MKTIPFKFSIISLSLAAALSGCSTLQPKVMDLESKVTKDIQTQREKADVAQPVVTSTSASWLAGAPIQIAEPVLPILNQVVTYHPIKAVTLADIGSWITQNTGLVVDIAELQNNANNGLGGVGIGGIGAAGGVGAGTVPSPVIQGGLGSNGLNANVPQQQSMYSMFVNYEGPLSGLLDVAANKSSAWWKIIDGKANFYRSETKTFYLPSVARKFTGDHTISSNTGSTNSSGGTSGVSTGVTSSGGANSISNYLVDLWTDLDKTAKTVGTGAQVSTNESAGSITVTGTPAQVRHIEDWVKGLTNQLSQQVAITIHVYSIKLNNEDNYSGDPSVVFKSATGILGYTISGADSPALVTSSNPMKLGINILSNAASGKTTQYSGSQLAFQALSSVGRVTEKINQTVVTMNGQPAPIQIANQQGYLASSSTTLTPNVGATSTLTPGNITTGFTAMFLPRIVNGKIILGMSMVNSSSNGFTTASSGGSTIMNPNVDGQSFQQSVSLTPGDALLLTSLQRDKGSLNSNGVGNPDNYLLGGGIDNTYGKQIVAIVVTARIL
jgi:type IVB pilus formation R64 PilN family outer membrane protein